MANQQEIEAYARHISSPESEALSRLNRDTHAMILRPRMLSGHLQGKLLETISLMLRPKYILEIGTYTGYSAICLAQGLASGGMLHTIDHNPELEDFTREYIILSGMQDRITQHIGEALDVIPRIKETFDLVFIDADKENYVRYFELAYEKLRDGGVIVADNVLWDGKPVDAWTGNQAVKDTDRDALGIIRFNEYIRQHKGISRLLLPFRDGVMICVKTNGGK